MSDLISRKALMEELFKTPKWDNRDEDVFFDLIDNQPTAYDIDKVERQLLDKISHEIISDSNGFLLDARHHYDIDIFEAIEIVKKGGAV